MVLIRNRKFAVILTVAVAVIATMLGVYRTSVRDTRNVESMFYDGVYLREEGYTQPGIASHLRNALNAALGLETVTSGYPGLADKVGALTLARRDLLFAADIRAISEAFSEMTASFAELFAAAMGENLSERDMDSSAMYNSAFSGASFAMSASSYNDEVDGYLNNRSFIARLIGMIVPLREPARFSGTISPAGT